MSCFFRLRRLKEKSHVQIPLADGRMLIGVVDETSSLRYGQVFIQLRNLNGERQVLKDCEVLITKNPAHFPGDIRKLKAVECAALHHLCECVVFPAEGLRPHPNEISGSDLDGDEVSDFIPFTKCLFCIHLCSIGFAGIKI